jgi:putative tricarboxylic transport membrane protein
VKAYDSLFAGLVLAAGIVYEVMALWMPRGRIGQPGPGFFPMIVGALLILTAAACLVQALMTRRAAGPITQPIAAPTSENRQVAKVWFLIGFLILYAVAVQPVGFPIALMLFLVASIRIFGYRKWLPALGIAAALTVISYVTFVIWLKVPLPLGILSDMLD